MEYNFVAEFPLARYAAAFAAKISGPGWWARDIVQKGRKVTFSATTPAGYEEAEHNGPNQLFMDYLGTVGAFGSTQSRKATLNGVKAPMEY